MSLPAHRRVMSGRTFDRSYDAAEYGSAVTGYRQRRWVLPMVLALVVAALFLTGMQ